MIYLLAFVIIVVIAGIYLFLKLPKFGRLPDTVIKQRIDTSAGFRKGSFQNKSITPDLTDGATYYSVPKSSSSKKVNGVLQNKRFLRLKPIFIH